MNKHVNLTDVIPLHVNLTDALNYNPLIVNQIVFSSKETSKIIIRYVTRRFLMIFNIHITNIGLSVICL